MTPRRLPLPRELIAVRPSIRSEMDSDVGSPGFMRKAWALTMHLACLWLFWLFCVSPLVSSIASGELAREFAPVLEAVKQMAAGAAKR
jgi:thiosulfate reductase cytochrome b subunit